MGKRTQIVRISMEGSERIRRECHGQFLLHLERALLLALKEEGFLDEVQYRRAESLFTAQCRKSPYNDG